MPEGKVIRPLYEVINLFVDVNFDNDISGATKNPTQAGTAEAATVVHMNLLPPADTHLGAVLWSHWHPAMSGVDVKYSYLSAWRGFKNLKEAVEETAPVADEGRRVDFGVY